MSLKRRLVVGALSLSAAGLVGIARYEGYSDEAYIPVAGDVPTIGFGSTEGVKMGDTITVPQALERLSRDVGEAEDCVNNAIRVRISQKTYDALVSLAYNIGCKNFSSSTLVQKFNSGDLVGGCKEIKRWVFSGGEKVKGLERRREIEYQSCLEGIENDGTANSSPNP